MMHKAWSSIEEVPRCFSRSYVKFQGHTALKIVEFYPNWEFPDCNSSLNSLMATKCCTKLETAKERCLIVFQGHPSIFKVTRDKSSPILTQIGRFRTIGRSQLSNPSDLPFLWASYGCTGFTLSVHPSVDNMVSEFRSISQVCFEIEISNFLCMFILAKGRSLLFFSDVSFKMATWWPYWIFSCSQALKNTSVRLELPITQASRCIIGWSDSGCWGADTS